MIQCIDCDNRTYTAILDFVKDLSLQINIMYDICPKIFLRFNRENDSGGATMYAHRISDMYIELDIPHNYTFGKINKTILASMLIHEYCHYIDAMTMTGRERVNTTYKYLSCIKYKRAIEQCNWTATKRLAKKLGLWNKSFYNAVRSCYYTAAVRF